MSTERDAWERLITMRVLTPDSLYSPAKAKDGFYSATLKAELKRQPQPDAAAQQSQPTLCRPSTTQLLAQLDQMVDELLLPNSTIPAADRVIHLRQAAQELGLALRDGDLQRRIWDGRRRAAGAIDMVQPGMPVDAPPTAWCWERLLLAADTNLLVAMPKTGKTTLLVAAIAAWHHRMPDYLGLPFHGPCPPVVIVGTDMPRSRWMPLLGRFGLAEQLTDGKWRLLPDGPIRGLFTTNEPIYLDPAGLSRIAEVVAKHPGCLLLLDSYSKCTQPLGLTEGDASFAGPLGDLQEVVAPFNVTSAVIHHSGHARKGEGAVAANRGTTALPAAVSQVIALTWFNRKTGSNDKRLLLETEGRGESIQLLVEQVDSGWLCHGDAVAATREQQLEEAESKLSDRQSDVLELARERAELCQRTDAPTVAKQLGIPLRQARRTLQQLEHRGFLTSRKEVTEHGQTVWFSP